MNDLHGILLAYRSDPALRELTQHRNTCSVPFGGRYRIIDFMLSGLVNAGVRDVGLIVHESYQSLLDHVGSGKDWDLSRKRGGLRILPPFSYADTHGVEGKYRGRMDALAGVGDYLENIRQDYVILADGALVANLPVAEIFQQHLDTGADITAVCAKTHKGVPTDCTYLAVDKNDRVIDVSVRPNTPAGHESLDVYILSKKLLFSLVDYCSSHHISSFGKGVLLSMKDHLTIMPYLFDGFAAQIQSVPAYFQASRDLLDPKVRASLFDPSRPIKTKDRSDPSTYYAPSASSTNSLVADGCIIEGEVKDSILFRGVRVEKGARVSNSILMQGTVVKADAIVSHVIADKNVIIGDGRMLMGSDTYPLAIAKNSVV